MDTSRGRAAFCVAGIENGQGFDRPETETNPYRHNHATKGSEGRRREGAEIGRATQKEAAER
jgi:hypothetical protein